MRSSTYRDAGVHRELGERVKDSIKNIAQTSHSENVLKDIGLFSGFYSLNLSDYQNPVLVSSIDGVGTKVKIAQMMNQYETIGVDLVNHCVNDITVCGADPLFFMDYIAADDLSTTQVEDIVRGITSACTDADCALIGGETAEMPGVYTKHSFDLAGSIVGIVEKETIIDGSSIEAGQVLVGVASNGLHTNGYSLVRKIFFEVKKAACSDYFSEIQTTLGEELLKPHLSYRSLITKIRRSPGLSAIAHITGGGIVDNVSRFLPAKFDLNIDWSAWEPLPVFELIKRLGSVSESEMRNVFNLGVGLVLIVFAEWVDDILKTCQSMQNEAFIMGEIIEK
ncbi:MAG: phosphoribosylformylglycinamidine cyclo-ligase [bacterium]